MSSCEECRYLIYDEELDEYRCKKQDIFIYDSMDHIDCELFKEK